MVRISILLLCLGHGAAWAQAPDSLAERLTVPDAECLTRAAIAAHLASWLGGDLAPDDPRRVVVHLGEAERTGVAFVLLRGDEPIGERRFEALPEPCPDRRAAFSLALAIALDAGVLERIGIASAANDSPEPTQVEPEEPRPPPTSDRPPTESPRVLRVGALLGLGVGSGLTPTWHGSLALALALGGERWELRLGAWATNRREVPLGSGRLDAQAVASSVLGCRYAPPVRRLSMGGCVGAMAGAWLGSGEGFAQSRSDRAAWIAGQAAMVARWPNDGAVRLTILARVVVPVLRASFVVREPTGNILARTSQAIVGGEGSAGVEITFR
ncbi:MAG: hypothetical protein JJ863_39020 [Deltaproteobacteria bacterium]|nr:hypothetical protein [Deltaproteobacteria bacterium]